MMMETLFKRVQLYNLIVHIWQGFFLHKVLYLVPIFLKHPIQGIRVPTYVVILCYSFHMYE